VIVDDWSIVGTSNMNRRSLLQDLELDVVTTKPETLELLVAEFENKLKSSERILKAGGFFAKLLGRLIEWFLSYWI
jgi:phosphatidylserine/phosphatidylglycerophosphate/cardiolipin synthase-like enzyme